MCLLAAHLKRPEIHSQLGMRPPKGFLLHGPPGCGKTALAEALAGELGLPLIRITSTELVGGISGESEEKIRYLFQKSSEHAPCIVLLDEIDVIAPKRENTQRQMDHRIVAQLISSLDSLNESVPPSSSQAILDGENDENAMECAENEHSLPRSVLVIGTTSHPDVIDPALRRAGRFDKEIGLGIPDEYARQRIFQIVLNHLRIANDVSIKELARLTPGYVGADLHALAREASMCSVIRVLETIADSRITSQRKSKAQIEQELSKMIEWLKAEQEVDKSKLDNLYITMDDFRNALTVVHPSAKREGFATVPDVTWNDIGALSEVRSELEWSILYPIKRPEDFEKLAISNRPQGILLWGPPGCGKTLLAKAIANETGMNFISVKGPELLSMYVGESEKAVRTVFQRARDSSPCVIFFDEIDALCPKRSTSETSGSARLVNQLLTEMDGIEARKQVFLIGATNRPDIVDPAILRPGRLDKLLYVGFPNIEDRTDILIKGTKNRTRPRISPEVDFHVLAANNALEGYTGADLSALIHEAGIMALKESLQSEQCDNATSSLKLCHFEQAISRIKPSVSIADRDRYAKLRSVYDRIG
jgi:ribosome biogenesis ATPase